MTTDQAIPTPAADGLAGKYITFELGGESFGVSVRQVIEIIRCIEITRVPKMSPHVLGVTNLRGRIIPVLDMRTKLGLSEASISDKTCTIVIEVPGASNCQTILGLVVDRVLEVVMVRGEQIEQPADYGGCLESASVVGIARIGDSLTGLLDLSHVLREELAVS